MRIAFFTLGCKVNQVETEALTEQALNLGYQVVDFDQPADIYVINTCTVTGAADKKSRAVIRRAGRKGAFVVLTGCFGDIHGRDGTIPPGADLVVPNRSKESLFAWLDKSLRGQDLPAEEDPCMPAVLYRDRHRRTRGFIKIEDGCESFCSYCIVPRARGPVRSKLPGDVVRELETLVGLEYREIVLTGIHIGQYGRDLGNWSLARLIAFVLREVPGRYRIRLGSVEPNEVEPRLIELLQEPRLCRHLHIPLQSGSDKILSLMNRSYQAGDYRKLLDRLVLSVPGIGLTTDVMVGFPGEGAEEFEETRGFIEESPLRALHVFRFSPRPGTPAEKMTGRVPEALKTERSHDLIKLGSRKKKMFMDSLRGEKLEILTEEETRQGIKSLSDNYVEVMLEAPSRLNEIYRVRAGENDGEFIFADGNGQELEPGQ